MCMLPQFQSKKMFISNLMAQEASVLCVAVASARGAVPAERSHPGVHGGGPLHVHAAPRAIPQALQQKGRSAPADHNV